MPHPDGSLRLVSSKSLLEGRLEISYHGLWMSVCGRHFTSDVADVVCRALGFGPAGNYCVDSW